jgi:DNA-binding transcriptional regulator YdaS (Cro superfamily)
MTVAAPMLDSLEVCTRLRVACKAAGGQSAWAERHSLSPAYVSDVLNARRDPGDSILRALGLRRVVRYVIERKVNG